MVKKVCSISLIILAIIASFITFYTTNFVLSDIANLTYGITNRPVYVLSSLPGLNLSLIFVLLFIYFIRLLRDPDSNKSRCKLYVIIGMSFSLIGLISAILSGLLVYKTFVGPNPFPGYLIISIILYSLLLIAGALFFIFFYPRMKKDTNKRKIKTSYVFYSIVLSITIFFAFNRFGALLWSFSYADVPSLYLTWPFYIYLFLPIVILAHTILYSFNFYKKHSGAALVTISILTGLFVIGTVYMVCLGVNNTLFISVISPAMGASRLLAKPIDFIFHTVVFGFVDGYALVHSIKYYRKHKKLK